MIMKFMVFMLPAVSNLILYILKSFSSVNFSDFFTAHLTRYLVDGLTWCGRFKQTPDSDGINYYTCNNTFNCSERNFRQFWAIASTQVNLVLIITVTLLPKVEINGINLYFKLYSKALV